MSLSFYIARRYLFGKKSKNVINYISGISVAVIAVVTMALFVILSIFNGLEGLIKSMYDSFDPDIKITSTIGKVFVPDSSFQNIKKMNGVIAYCEVLEEDILLKHKDKQFIGRIKGVSGSFDSVSAIHENIIYGSNRLGDSVIDYVMMGQGLAYSLSVGMQQTEPIHMYAPTRSIKKIVSPEHSYKHVYAYPSGIFETQQDIDNKYVVSSICFTRDFLGYTNQVSAIEIKVSQYHGDEIKKNIQSYLGTRFQVKDRFEQHGFVYKVLQSEKWGIILIVSLILLIASFNVVGALTMLIIDKKKDISILKSMGATDVLVQNIFLIEGLMISLLGAIIGLSAGVVLCWLQMEYGFLKLSEGGSFVVSSYPVIIKYIDILWVFVIVSIIGFFAACIPVKTRAFKTLEKM